MVNEAVAQTTQNPGPMLPFSQEDATGVGGDFTAVESADDLPSVQAAKLVAVMKDDAQLLKKFMDDRDFKRLVGDASFQVTYKQAGSP